MKYVLYKKKEGSRDKLIFKKVDSEGNVSLIQDANVLESIIQRFISRGYKPIIKGSNLYLYSKNSVFILRRFSEIIDCKYLTSLKESLLTKIPEKKWFPDQRKNNKGFKSLLADFLANRGEGVLLTAGVVAACTISVVAVFNNNASSLDTAAYADNGYSTLAYTSEQAIEPTQLEDEQDEFDIFQVPFELPLFRKYGQYSFIENKMVPKDFLAIQPSENGGLATDNTTLEETVEPEEPKITYEQKSYDIRQKYYLTRDMLNRLLICMCDNTMPGVCFANSQEALDYLYTTEDRTYPEKMLIVMIREGLTYEQLDDICAGVRAEGGEYYDECCRVASVGYNRYRSIDFNNWYGAGLYTQFLAPGQFSVFYGDKMYLDYKGATDSIGYQAAVDTFFYRDMVTDYLSFRGWWVNVSGNWENFMRYGNKYSNHQASSDVLKLDYEYAYEQEMIEDLGVCSEMVLPDLADETFVYDDSSDTGLTQEDGLSRNLTRS